MPSRQSDLPTSSTAPSAEVSEPNAYFSRVADHTYRPTRHTAGAWSEVDQHISPLNGLVVHAMEQFTKTRNGGGDGKDISRVSFDILGPVAIEAFDVAVDVLRAGRSVELVEATVTSRSREVLRARAWRLDRFDTEAVLGGQPPHIPAPGDLPSWEMTSVWPGGYIASLDVRRSPDSEPGRTTAWVSSALDLLAGEPVSSLAGFVALVDTANGLCVRRAPGEWLFPNVDLTIHLHRQPVPGPVGFDTSVVFGPAGHGVTSTVLHDRQGPVGQAAQSLTVRPRATRKPDPGR